MKKCEPASTSLGIKEQDAAIKLELQKNYSKESIYKANVNYVGFGVSSDLKLRKNDIVGVIKKADPCGNPNNWFVDNGSALLFFFVVEILQNSTEFLFIVVKGIMPSSILQKFDNIDIKNQNDFSHDVGTVTIITDSLKVNYTHHKERRQSTTSNDSFEEDEPPQPLPNPQPSLTVTEYCTALYNFDALDSNTLTISEGEKLKVVQKNDDNLNSEWWLVEKENKTIGYVPSNYVEIINNNNNLDLTSSASSDMNASAII